MPESETIPIYPDPPANDQSDRGKENEALAESQPPDEKR